MLRLQRLVSDALIEQGRLEDPFDLRPDRLYPGALDNLLDGLTRQPYDLAYLARDDEDKTMLPLYRNGRTYVVVEHRQSEERYSIFVGRDPLDIRFKIGQDMERRNVCTSVDEVELQVS